MQILLSGEPDSRCVDQYEASLTAPRDDMWASFSDMATTRAILVDGVVAGFCSVDEGNALHRFFVRPALVNNQAQILAEVVAQLGLTKAYPCTIDLAFTQTCLAVGARNVPVGLMYHHTQTAPETPGFEMQVSAEADLDRAVAFVCAATDDTEEFLRPYVAVRVSRRELFMMIEGSEWLAIGECRKDDRAPGFAHVGMIVGQKYRGAGLGTQVLSYLVQIAFERGWAPLCSTEPENRAARRAIERVGFREYHQVLRVDL